MRGLVTENELAQARRDPRFRRKLLAESLDGLLAALNRMRKRGEDGPDTARQMREGVDLAVMLADRLQAGPTGQDPQAASAPALHLTENPL